MAAIDDADATDFHVEAYDVVPDEAVAALENAEDALALTDAAGDADEGADAEDVNHGAVLAAAGVNLGLGVIVAAPESSV